MEKIYPHVYITLAILWALIFCMVPMLLIKWAIGAGGGLVSSSEWSLFEIGLGVFLKGSRYWRR
jgi:hypothetical protein